MSITDGGQAEPRPAMQCKDCFCHEDPAGCEIAAIIEAP